MDFRIRQLQCFLTLSGNLNYGKTAKTLYMSQPTITFQIQSLEDAFGAKLFERDRKSVRLTAQGKAMQGYARSILALVEESREHIRHIKEPHRLRVSCGANGMFDLLPSVLRTLARHYPSFDLEAIELTTEEKMERLATRQIDAIVMTPRLPISGTRFVPLTVAPMRVLVSRQHSMAQRAFISMRDLDGAAILITRPEDCRFSRPNTEKLLSDYGIQATLVETPHTCSVQLAYVAAGVGVLFSPVVAQCENRNDIVALPIQESLPAVELGYMVAEDDHRDALTILEQVLTLCAARAKRPAHESSPRKDSRDSLIEFPRSRAAR